MSKVSVIVIIYKVEKFLEQCLLSIKNQTYKNLEIICVVGKGDTGCETIVDDFAAKDERFVVIKAEPKGTSDARNRGLDAAHGEYIAFVDGDDYIDSDMIETMVQSAIKHNAPISVVGKYYDYVNCIDGSDTEEEKVFNTKEAFETILYQEGFFLHLWDKLYAREIFEGIRFPLGKLVEDRQIAHKLLSGADRICYNTKSKYHFRVSQDSGSKIEENLRMSLKADYEICDELRNQFEGIEPAVDFFLVNENLSVIQNSFLYNVYSRKHDAEYLKYVKANASKVLNNTRVPGALKIKMCMCIVAPGLFKWVTLSRRKKFVAAHVEYSLGNDWKATFKNQGISK